VQEKENGFDFGRRKIMRECWPIIKRIEKKFVEEREWIPNDFNISIETCESITFGELVKEAKDFLKMRRGRSWTRC
jgi:hypothetical protein